MATFLFSGLWHEAAISLTARGGYGLPTLYFLIQGLGMTIERRWQRRTTGAPRPWFVRATTATIVVLPLPLLFHRPFAERVIIPLLHVLGVF
jgi:alginate O-acetyltransferase complex protein AlgI